MCSTFQGQVLSVHIAGLIVMKSYLSGMPVYTFNHHYIPLHFRAKYCQPTSRAVSWWSCISPACQCTSLIIHVFFHISGPSIVSPRRRPYRDEVVPLRHARVQVRHQRQGSDGEQGRQIRAGWWPRGVCEEHIRVSYLSLPFVWAHCCTHTWCDWLLWLRFNVF